jgi:hypothetical protein
MVPVSSLSSRSRLREWPRLIVAAVTVAILLVLVGVAVAAAVNAGGSAGTGAAAGRLNREAVALRAADARVRALTRQAQSATAQLSLSRRALFHTRIALARARQSAACWRAVVRKHTNPQACARARRDPSRGNGRRSHAPDHSHH